MLGISKSFSSTRVLDEVDLCVAAGEVRALVGQNGAGKSTLMKILGGVHGDYAGEIRLDREAVRFASPRVAFDAGVSTIHQEFSLVPAFSVAENVMLGREPGRRGRYSTRAVRAAAAEAMKRAGLRIPLDVAVDRLGVAGQQMTEIVKAVSRNPRVMVMDEPSARLSKAELPQLFEIVRSLADRGVAVIYISHHLEELPEVADTVTVLRDGRVVSTMSIATTSLREIAHSMLGAALEEELKTARPGAGCSTADVLLEVDALEAAPRLAPTSFTLRSGDVLGIAGLVGSGRTTLAGAIVGSVPTTGGQVRFRGRNLPQRRGPGLALHRGIALVPEDRKTQGLVLNRPAGENLALMALQRVLSRFGVVNLRRRKSLIDDTMVELNVTPADPSLEAQFFSGGNQQKILLGKAMASGVDVVVLDQPSAGVDIGTKVQIRRLVEKFAVAGGALIVISDDIDELLAMSSRLLIMRHGEVVRVVEDVEALKHNRVVELITSAD